MVFPVRPQHIDDEKRYVSFSESRPAQITLAVSAIAGVGTIIASYGPGTECNRALSILGVCILYAGMGISVLFTSNFLK